MGGEPLPTLIDPQMGWIMGGTRLSQGSHDVPPPMLFAPSLFYFEHMRGYDLTDVCYRTQGMPPVKISISIYLQVQRLRKAFTSANIFQCMMQARIAHI